MNFSDYFVDELNNTIIEYCNLNFNPRITTDGLNDNELSIASSLNFLAEELNSMVLLSSDETKIIKNTLSLVKTSKTDTGMEGYANIIRDIIDKKNTTNLSAPLLSKKLKRKKKSKDIKLSPKETLIARHIANEFTTKEMSEILEINSRTLETIRARIIKKIGAKNTAGIVKFALINGIV